LYKCGASGNLCSTIVQTIIGFFPGTSSENEQQCNSQDSSSELQIVTIEKKYRDMQTHTQVAASQKSGLRNNGHTRN
jgi:hypothetical protein